MNTGVRLGAFSVALAAVFGAGAGLGALVGPIDVGGSRPHREMVDHVPDPCHDSLGHVTAEQPCEGADHDG